VTSRDKRGRQGTKTDLSIVEGLPALLDEQRMSQRALAKEAQVDQSHLSRALNGEGRISGDLAGRVARALGLPEDYFPEFRAAAVREAIDADPAFRDAVYRQFLRRRCVR
jgi:transcriptional regulator with XRE-family HTH domain